MAFNEMVEVVLEHSCCNIKNPLWTVTRTKVSADAGAVDTQIIKTFTFIVCNRITIHIFLIKHDELVKRNCSFVLFG